MGCSQIHFCRSDYQAILAVLTALNLVLVMKISGLALYIGLAVLGFISAPFMALLLLILMDTSGVETGQMGAAVGMFSVSLKLVDSRVL
ncbi:MAG: hypothetical protein KJP23_18865 [Deltaproteobacteria bacterium]|nr:hypothetical protein [Deltaproteobacteria bacterium]